MAVACQSRPRSRAPLCRERTPPGRRPCPGSPAPILAAGGKQSAHLRLEYSTASCTESVRGKAPKNGITAARLTSRSLRRRSFSSRTWRSNASRASESLSRRRRNSRRAMCPPVGAPRMPSGSCRRRHRSQPRTSQETRDRSSRENRRGAAGQGEVDRDHVPIRCRRSLPGQRGASPWAHGVRRGEARGGGSGGWCHGGRRRKPWPEAEPGQSTCVIRSTDRQR